MLLHRLYDYPLSLCLGRIRLAYAVLVERDVNGLVQLLPLQLKTQWLVVLKDRRYDSTIPFAV